jgi:glutamate 5-kinase
VDEGATAAILERGSSLLPKGIKSVTGNFSRGEVIRIRNLEGRDIAHGVSRYNSDALRRIAGTIRSRSTPFWAMNMARLPCIAMT